MKICYVGNFSQAHCTEVHLAATLEDLGHEVVRIQELDSGHDDWINQVNGNVGLFLYTRTWGNMVRMEHLEELRRRGIPSASYHLDLYVGLKREDGLDDDPFWRTDYVFTPDGSPEAAEVFKAKGINHYYMKPGVFKPECYMAQPHVFNPDDPTETIVNVGNDVVFVGGGSATGEGPQYGHNEWPYRGQLIKFLQDTYGNKFSKYGWPQETVRNAPLNQLYANTKVVVGDSLCLNFNRPYYWSDRACETIGRGGFLIHPFIEGMQEEFTDGETIVFYEFNNWAQLKEKIDYYIEHDEERERIRLAGHEFVKNNCTYHERLKLMLGIVFSKDEWLPDGRGVTNPKLNADLNQYFADHENDPIKISLGAGHEPEEDFINVDIVDLPGIDVVHNLMQYPWPFEDNSADYIKAKDVIEHMATHLPDGRNSVIAFIEECNRILKPGGTLWIQTPSWQADFFWIDPTHVRPFDIRSFDFFDPETDFGRATGFYSEAKFKVTATQTENNNLQFEMVKL